MKNITDVLQYVVLPNGNFPNNFLPVVHYRQAIPSTGLFRTQHIRKLFQQHDWGNNWHAGIFTYHHYHSNTAEVMGIIKGKTTLMLGGENGTVITIQKGDVLVIPPGVAHRNLGFENAVSCIGGYPGGTNYDMYYGHDGERAVTDAIIARVPIPATDPVTGTEDPLISTWKKIKIPANNDIGRV